jgi:hypothetical protein
VNKFTAYEEIKAGVTDERLWAILEALEDDANARGYESGAGL